MEYIYQIILNTVILASLYSLLALGFNLIYSTNKFFDLTYSAYLVITAYSFLTLSKFQLQISICVIFSLLVSIVFAVILEKFLYTNIRQKKASSSVQMITSLGVLTVVQAVIALIFTSNIQTLSSSNAFISFGNLNITYVQIFIIAFAAACYILIYLILKFTKFSKNLE